jgi:hypothetical protein
VIGPAIAGTIYGAAGSATIFAVDAGSFVVSAGLLLLARPRAYEAPPSEGLGRDLAAGFRYVVGVPWLWITIGMSRWSARSSSARSRRAGAAVH